MKEFDFIHHYLTNCSVSDDELINGIGDDAATLRFQSGFDWHISSDMLVCGRHFFDDVKASDLAHKVLAVNLSDMAAMGATPRYVLLSAALPKLDKVWLDDFFNTFFNLAKQFGVKLIGGDTVKGDFVFNVTILGQTPQGQSLQRNSAQVGDDIWVSGLLGLAAAGLDFSYSFRQPEKNSHINNLIQKLPQPIIEQCIDKLLRPNARVDLGVKLLPYANSALDISDGLVQDLNHILHSSKVGAEIYLSQIPTLPELEIFANYHQWILAGGDDYELVFTANPCNAQKIKQISKQTNIPVYKIGKINHTNNLKIIKQDGSLLELAHQGFDHYG